MAASRSVRWGEWSKLRLVTPPVRNPANPPERKTNFIERRRIV
jgi:hypothetical protein